jgi:2-phospho-L-lactate guanylyltransferase
VLAIVPVKRLEDAKSRLAPGLSEAKRQVLVRRMLASVLAACDAARLVDGVLVVTPDPGLAPGRDVLVDPGVGHALAIALALRDERARCGAVVVMADCPFASPESLDALVEAARPVALVPAGDGGMNALALADPTLFEPAFGQPESARVTAARARSVGIEPRLLDDAGLAFDVDRPEDLDLVRPLLAA